MKRLLMLLCFLVPGVVLAQTLADAEALYADGELPAAMKAAEAALKRASSPTELAKLHALRGLVLLAQNKKDKAKAAFAQALQADAGAQLDAQRVPPTAVPLFEQAREQVPPGSVSLSSAADATVRIDGAELGPLPLTTRLPVGRHQVEATDGKGEVMRAEVLVRSGEAHAVVLTPQVLPPEPQAAATQPTVNGVTETTRVSLLEDARPPVKQTYWGLIPIIVAAGGGWLGPPLLVVSSTVAWGAFASLGAAGLLAVGTALLASSAAGVESANGVPAKMNWWGIIPLGLGLAAVPFMLATHPSVNGWSLALVSGVAGAIAIVGLGVGTGMLVGRALAIGAHAPKVSFFVLPQSAGLAFSGRF